MILRTVVRDCLYLNWALPAGSLPPAPEPLRYDLHPWEEGEVAFASALLFRQQGLHLPRLPLVRLSYSQFNLRLYVLDRDNVPSVLFHTVLVPAWVAPSMRVVGEQPALAAQFDYPRPSREPDAGSWSWLVRRGGELRVTARQQAPFSGHGPSLGPWERLTRFFNQRRRGYFETGSGLRRVDATHQATAFWPLEAELERTTLLADRLPLAGREWPALHSAFLCPEIPFVFELGEAEEPHPSPAPVPVAADPATYAVHRWAGRAAA